jgi:hypothetical protein
MILVTNGKHFSKIRDKKIITVWNTKEALDYLS